MHKYLCGVKQSKKEAIMDLSDSVSGLDRRMSSIESEVSAIKQNIEGKAYEVTIAGNVGNLVIGKHSKMEYVDINTTPDGFDKYLPTHTKPPEKSQDASSSSKYDCNSLDISDSSDDEVIGEEDEVSNEHINKKVEGVISKKDIGIQLGSKPREEQIGLESKGFCRNEEQQIPNKNEYKQNHSKPPEPIKQSFYKSKDDATIGLQRDPRKDKIALVNKSPCKQGEKEIDDNDDQNRHDKTPAFPDPDAAEARKNSRSFVIKNPCTYGGKQMSDKDIWEENIRLDAKCKELKRQYNSIISARPVYTKEKGRQAPVIMAEISENTGNMLHEYEGIPVKYVLSSNISNEGKEIFMKEKKLTDTETHRLLEVLKSKTESLDKNHKFITSISISYWKSIGYGKPEEKLEHKPCIVIYCENKGYIPYDEEPFPTDINGVDTDIREGCCTLFHFPYDMQHKLRIGAAIRGLGKGICTLGPFYKHLNEGICAVTAGHGLVSSEELRHFGASPELREYIKKNSFKLEQPPNSNRIIATAFDIAIEPGGNDKAGVDIGLLKLHPSNDVEGALSLDTESKLRDAGFDIKYPPKYKGKVEHNVEKWKNSVVYSLGAESGMTYGMMLQDGLFVKRIHSDISLPGMTSPYRLFNQIEVRPSVLLNPPRLLEFAKAGDSGSLVYYKQDASELIGVGIILGGTSYGSCVVTPIKGICELLGFSAENNQPFLAFPSDQDVNYSIQSLPQLLSNLSLETTFFPFGNLSGNLTTYAEGNSNAVVPNIGNVEQTTLALSNNELNATSPSAKSSCAEHLKHEIVMSSKSDMRGMYEKTVDTHKDMAGQDSGLKKTAMEQNTIMLCATSSNIKELTEKYVASLPLTSKQKKIVE